MLQRIKIFAFLLISFFVAQVGTAQTDSYILLKDPSGLGPSVSENAELEKAADSLVAAFPATYQDQFKVIVGALYPVLGYTEKGVEDSWMNLKSEANNKSTYFLLVVKEYLPDGDVRWRFDLHLPHDNYTYFKCFTEIKKKFLHSKIDSKLSIRSTNNDALIGVLKMCKEYLIELRNCCDLNRDTCSECINSDSLKDVLIDMGFLGINTSNISSTSTIDLSLFDNSFDYATINVEGLNVKTIFETYFSELSNSDFKIFYTNNESICEGNNFTFIDSVYNISFSDYDVWIHHWQSDDHLSNILFVKTDFYIVLDDPEFIPYFEGLSLPTMIKSSSRNGDEVSFITIDPVNGEVIIRNSLELTVEEIFQNQNDPSSLGNLPAQEFVVVKNGDNLSDIANDYGNIFSIEDLVRWNPTKLASINTPLTIGWELLLFTDEYVDMALNELIAIPLTSPILNRINGYSYFPSNSSTFLLKEKLTSSKVLQDLLDEIEIKPNQNKPPNIKPSTWDAIKDNAKFWGTRASMIIGLMLVSTPASAPAPRHVEFARKTYNPDPFNKSRDGYNLTFCTYTKRNPTIQNRKRPGDGVGLTLGKVYIGRTSGYHRNPRMLVSIRDVSHHKSKGNAGYQKAYLDQFENTNQNFLNRKLSIAYQLIRGREQLVIENLGEAWSEMPKLYTVPSPKPSGFSLSDYTRSGNAINGIAKTNAIYITYTLLALNKYGKVTITWDGAAEYY